jgi:hypothetical protein
MFSFWTRNEHRGCNDQIHAPEFLMSGDVLRRDATGAFRESGIIASLLFAAKFVLGMREEIGAVTVEREHEEQLGIQARGGNLICGEASDSRGESGFKLHESISPQRHGGHGKNKNRENRIQKSE